jgi:hypothetical protein
MLNISNNYDDFYLYMVENTPVLIKIDKKNYSKLYKEIDNLFLNRKQNDCNNLDYDKILKKNVIVTASNLDEDDHNITSISYSNNKSKNMTLKEFIDKSQLLTNPLIESLYAKDIHVDKIFESNLYTIPKAFIDDWLDHYYTIYRGNTDDYSFLYMGGLNTKTLIHHDVLCSYSWSINLHGKKLW